jgi:glycosyltransferase involved in cell wall biosynthesis
MEVVGDAGLFVDAADVAGFAAAMRQLAEDPALRAQLAMRSLQRAAGFSWEACVRQTIAAYRFALSNSR